jgi:exodeoxyribonuclease V alpha subunit
MSVLEGILDRVVFANEDDGWSVVRLLIEGEREPLTAVGNLLGVRPGESVRLTGTWQNDRTYGQQFRVESWVTMHPATLVGIQRYLGSGLVKGIGKAMAERLVVRFGLKTLDVIERHGERLTEVDGIGPMRSRAIQEAWAQQKEIREVMIFLQAHGVSATYAVKIYKRYGPRSIAVVRENPYQLAEDIFGIGFKTADRIAASLGVAPTSPYRARAGVLHMLSEHADAGHVLCPQDRLVESTAQALAVDAHRIEQAIETLAHEGKIVREADVVDDPAGHAGDELRDQREGDPSGPHRAIAVARTHTGSVPVPRVFLKSLHVAESGAARLLRQLLAAPTRAVAIDLPRAIAWFQSKAGLQLADRQKDAVALAVQRKVVVITGGPGTGKTTLVTAILRILERKGWRILLCAPTGRAARRLFEATGRPALTIHRLLEFSPRTMEFARRQDHPLEADLVVADEVSMVDVVLFYDLLKALPPSCQLVLVGDVDQLPSVGPGAVLADLIRSRAVDVVRLDHIFRQAQRSSIVVNAHRINHGQMPCEQAGDEAGDFFFIERDEPDQILAALEELVARRIPRRFGLDPLNDIQVLTPMHKGELGARQLNERLQQLLNPDRPGIARRGLTYRVGDKVMQTRNNYRLEVFNGDIGRISDLDIDADRVTVDFEGRRVDYESADLDELVLAYACSVHKAQGSEYPAVVMPLHTQHYALLQRNLLYTAVTRGKQLVTLVGSRKALAIAVRNASRQRRMTWLAERLAGAGAARSGEAGGGALD